MYAHQYSLLVNNEFEKKKKNENVKILFYIFIIWNQDHVLGSK